MAFHSMAVNTNTRMRWEALKGLEPFKALRGKRVLDIGAGLGFFSARFAAGGAQVVALDTDSLALEYLRMNYGIEGKLSDVERDPLPSGSFDLIFIGDVIEHVRDYNGLISKAKNALAKGGSIILTTPAMEGKYSRSQGKRLGHEAGGEKHERDGFYAQELRDAFERAGMKVCYHSFCVFSLAELFMQLTKKGYLKTKHVYGRQSDVLSVVNSPKYKTLLFIYPALMAFFRMEQYFGNLTRAKGHCHVMIAC